MNIAAFIHLFSSRKLVPFSFLYFVITNTASMNIFVHRGEFLQGIDLGVALCFQVYLKVDSESPLVLFKSPCSSIAFLKSASLMGMKYTVGCGSRSHFQGY